MLTAQRRSRAFHETYSDIEGVRYPASPTGRACVALYERAEPAISGSSILRLHRALDDEAMHGAPITAAETIGHTIV